MSVIIGVILKKFRTVISKLCLRAVKNLQLFAIWSFYNTSSWYAVLFWCRFGKM